jgi:hypothetical protein
MGHKCFSREVHNSPLFPNAHDTQNLDHCCVSVWEGSGCTEAEVYGASLSHELTNSAGLSQHSAC